MRYDSESRSRRREARVRLAVREEGYGKAIYTELEDKQNFEERPYGGYIHRSNNGLTLQWF